MSTVDEFDRYHEQDLPARLDGDWGEVAARGASGLPPLAFRLKDGRAWTYVPGPRAVAIERGDAHAKTVVELDEAIWRGLRDAMETTNGLTLFEKATVVAGDVADFVRWDSALRVLYEGLPPYDPSAKLVGLDGREVDPTRSFRPDDDPEEMADFLRTTGYILVREVIPLDEVEALVAEAEALRAEARPGEPTSWWGRFEDGRSVLTRVLDGGRKPRIRALLQDPRLLRIVALSDAALEPTDTDMIHVLFKQSGLVFDGKADNPWHRDCGLGLHASICPLANGSLFLNEATPETGELRFLPGSWKTAGFACDVRDRTLGVGLVAGPGDFSLHYGDGLHAGPPPTAAEGPFRSSIVFEYGPPGRAAGEGQEHYDLQLHDKDTSSLS